MGRPIRGAATGVYNITRSWHDLDDSWMPRGACVDVPADVRALFFADDERGKEGAMRVKAAKVICMGCDVRVECLAYALAANQQGIWGMTTERERKGTRRRRVVLTAVSVSV